MNEPQPTNMPDPAEIVRNLAARTEDPAERESLLRSAQQIEEAARSMLEGQAQLQAAIDRIKAEIEKPIKRDTDVPLWFAILVGCAVFGWLALSYLQRHH